MRYLLLSLLFLTGFTSQSVVAQPAQYTSAKDSDPEAVALVKKLRAKYDGYKTLEADFRLDISLPGQQTETQKGKIQRQGDLVRFRLGPQEGIVTADAAYLIQHGNKEVMISDLAADGEQAGVLTPQTLFSFYEGENYVLALRGEESVAGRKASVIELKPIDRNNSEFTKLRLLVDAAKKEIISVSAFSRDGSRFTFYLDRTVPNARLNPGTFVFDKKDFPGYYVEDLRY